MTLLFFLVSWYMTYSSISLSLLAFSCSAKYSFLKKRLGPTLLLSPWARDLNLIVCQHSKEEAILSSMISRWGPINYCSDSSVKLPVNPMYLKSSSIAASKRNLALLSAYPWTSIRVQPLSSMIYSTSSMIKIASSRYSLSWCFTTSWKVMKQTR